MEQFNRLILKISLSLLEMLKEIKFENTIREERKEGIIEWEFNKEQTSKKGASY